MSHQMSLEEIMELKGEMIDVPGMDVKVDTKSYYLWLGTRLDTPALLNEFAGVEPEAAVAEEPPAVPEVPAGVAKEPYDQWWLVVPAVPVQQIVWAEVLEVLPPVHAASDSEGSEGDGATLEFGTVAVFVPSVPPPIPPSDVFSSSSYTSERTLAFANDWVV